MTTPAAFLAAAQTQTKATQHITSSSPQPSAMKKPPPNLSGVEPLYNAQPLFALSILPAALPIPITAATPPATAVLVTPPLPALPSPPSTPLHQARSANFVPGIGSPGSDTGLRGAAACY
jgi:hypothetical protein